MADRSLPRPTNVSDLLATPGPPEPSPPRPRTGTELRIEDLILFDTAGSDPVSIDSIVFTDEGIGVVRARGTEPRVLPWSAVSAHVVERWPGGVVPAWWVMPQPRPRGSAEPPAANPERGLPHAARGAVIAVQTPFGTYRFLRPGADPVELSNRITDFAVRHKGLSGVPSVTLVARPRRGGDRRQGSRSPPPRSGWTKAKPYLIVALVVFVVAAVTLILLQSAGVIHLPYLGGSGSGAIVTSIRTG